MAAHFTPVARRLGIVSAITVVMLAIVYALALAVGFMKLQSPDEPIGDPMFTIMEVVIIAMMPAMVALMVAVYAWTANSQKVLALLALVFMVMVATVTSSLHFVILTAARDANLASEPWLRFLLSFQWPSVAYALDILAWDVFFALSVLFAAPVFSGTRLHTSIRLILTLSGVLALAGLSGVMVGDMRLRNVGIIGYAGFFPVAAGLLALVFVRTTAVVSGSEPAQC